MLTPIRSRGGTKVGGEPGPLPTRAQLSYLRDPLGIGLAADRLVAGPLPIYIIRYLKSAGDKDARAQWFGAVGDTLRELSGVCAGHAVLTSHNGLDAARAACVRALAKPP